MGTFLFLLIFIFIVLPLIRAAWSVHKIRSQARRAFEQMADTQRREQERRRRDNRPAGWQHAPTTSKIINKNEGEYVDWEEVTTTETSTSTTDTGHTRTSSRGSFFSRKSSATEQRITDAEWEDITTD